MLIEWRCKLVFGNVVYYDKKKIDEYRAVVKGQRNLQFLILHSRKTMI